MKISLTGGDGKTHVWETDERIDVSASGTAATSFLTEIYATNGGQTAKVSLSLSDVFAIAKALGLA